MSTGTPRIHWLLVIEPEIRSLETFSRLVFEVHGGGIHSDVRAVAHPASASSAYIFIV
jgi:hypothetical protein